MARFRISPGVSIREIDQSQYASTQPGSGDIAAVIGYAEKGPFEPTLITSAQDFNLAFGYSLEDAPYLAQTVYKYFEQGSQVLIVRAGDDRDPDQFPTGAKTASTTIRVNPAQRSGEPGTATFADNSAAVTGGPGQAYELTFTADPWSFEEQKTVETLAGSRSVITELWNNMASGAPSPATSFRQPLVKIAFDPEEENSMEVFMKVNWGAGDGSNSYEPVTAYYRGIGTRTGRAGGDTFDVTLNNELSSGVSYQHEINMNGRYGAVAIGSENIKTGGADWSDTPVSFTITLGGEDEEITLNTTQGSDSDVAAHVNAKLEAKGLADSVEALVYKPNSTLSVLALRHIGTETGFALSAGTGQDALVEFGITPGSYNDTDWVSGTYNTTNVSTALGTFNESGIFAFRIKEEAQAQWGFMPETTVTLTAPAGGSWSKTDLVDDLNTAFQETMFPTAPDADWVQTANQSSLEGEFNPEASFVRASLEDNRVVLTVGKWMPDGSFNPISSTTDGVSRVFWVAGTLTGLIGTASLNFGDQPGEVGDTAILVHAKEKGTYGNDLVLRTETERITTGQVTLPDQYNVYVYWKGKEVAAYIDVNWTDPDHPRHVQKAMARDKYLVVEPADENEDETFVTIPDGDWKIGSGELPSGVTSDKAVIASYTVGTNGWVEDEQNVITSVNVDVPNALQKITNPEVYEFNLVIAPAYADPVIQNAIQALCDSRRDCFGILDAAPFGLGISIKNKYEPITAVNDASSSITSSYVACYWSWVQDYDSDNGQYVWLPPSTYALRQMAYTDAVADPWFAPAGTRRGRITALGVEYSPSQIERDLLYGPGRIVNPIVNFKNEGLTIWGQKTGQRINSATDRVNVRRLLIYAEKLVARMARGFLFEPNDPANWSAFARQANAILEPIRQRRGLTTYQVVCDETTNTPELIDQNIMHGKIFVQPTKSIEIVQIDFTINAASGETTITE